MNLNDGGTMSPRIMFNIIEYWYANIGRPTSVSNDVLVDINHVTTIMYRLIIIMRNILRNVHYAHNSLLK